MYVHNKYVCVYCIYIYINIYQYNFNMIQYVCICTMNYALSHNLPSAPPT